MTEAGISKTVDASRFPHEPELMMWQTRNESLSMSPEDVADIQLAALKFRFESLRERIPVLARLAAEQGVSAINNIEDGGKLLFKHSVYKSYPLSLIEKNRFDRLTSWLGNLTTVDLSGIDASEIDTIDGWLDLLNEKAGLRLIHSTGTSGKLSFLPRAETETQLAMRSFRLGFEGDHEILGMDHTTVIVPSYRRMYNGYGASLDAIVRFLFHGDESRVLTLYPGRLSADVLSLGGRLAAAQDKGERGEMPVSQALLARREAFIQQQKSAPQSRAAFFDTISTRLKGARVTITSNWSMLFEMAEEGLAKGISNVFAPDSYVMTAGGTKGKTLPADYKAIVKSFLGVDNIAEGFGMSEMISLMPKCEADQYHAMPWMILYLLDGKTGELKPRTGTHTGRFGVMDLCAQTYWGGVLSGDEVTMNFGTCACGRPGPSIAPNIRRFSEAEGGDDKITCAGAPEAHDNALAFLADFQ